VVTSLLYTPLAIGTFETPNRFVQTAHSKQYSDRLESERETAYYVRRAQGGCGLFVAGNHFVHPTGSIRNFEDAYLPESIAANQRMTNAIHGAGSRIVVQLNHHGAQAQHDGPFGPRPVYAPSRMISPSTGQATRAASAKDIEGFVNGWARSAELAREGGFDGVEIHMAHGYLLHQFLSPLYNFREDEYGGDVEGRTRFPREVLRAVRAAVGDDFTVGIRIVANEFHPDGMDAADLREVIARLRAEARIDFLDIAAGGYHNVHYVFPTSPMPVAWLREEAAALKAANPDIPVFGVGSALSVEEAADVVESGIADLVALTRAQLADPDLATKLREGRTDEIRHCIRLNQGCLGRGSRGLPMTCTVNPIAGRELIRGPRPAATSADRWLVVGGGPAGMRAAIELATDGYAVTLVERTAELGGQLRYASRVPGRESIGLLISDLTRDLARMGVDVRLATEATAELVAELDPAGTVIATGAGMPGGATRTTLASGSTWDGGAVADVALDAFTALDSAPGALGDRIAVVDSDGTPYASGVVLSLLPRVASLELVTAAETIFQHIGAGYDRPLLIERLGAHPGFRRRTAHRVGPALPQELIVHDVVTGERSVIEGIDTVVAIEPRASVVPAWVDESDPRIRIIGDAVSPRGIDAAIHEAVEVAYAVASGGELIYATV